MAEIARMAGASPAGGVTPAAVATGYSIDSRTTRPGDVFFAVRGTRDGHLFVDAAIGAGAAAAVAARGPLKHIGRLLLTPDPQGALQRLAAQVRNRWGGRVVAVTGSNGKTTTKEIAAALIGTRFRVAKTEGNLNNELGLPLSLLRMNDDAEVGVMELGMNHPGEIRALATIARPDVGVVTNVGPAHLEFFRSVDDIALAKREMIESLPETGVAVLNADDPRVRRFAEVHRGRVVTFGIDASAEIRATEVEEMGLSGTQFRLDGTIAAFHTPLAGRHNLYNTLAGIAAAWALGIAPESLCEVVRNLRPAPMRGEVIDLGEIRIINDCYNSNPRAAETMLELLAKTPARRRVAVLGEMLELGERSEELHREIGRRAAELKIDLLAGVRGAAKALVDGARTQGLPDRAAYFFEDVPQAAAFLKGALEPGDVVLLKASRGVKLERVLEAIRAEG